MNVSATINVLRLFWNPNYCMPHMSVSTFNDIPNPLSIASKIKSSDVSIKAVVLDKDNCFAKAHEDRVWPEYQETWSSLRKAYPGAQLLIVSNSAGTDDDAGHKQALKIESETGVTVLRHSTKKPGCHKEIMDYFYKNNTVSGPHEVAVIGDRLFTDILMANMMGSYGIWVRDGVFPNNSLICKIERNFFNYLSRNNVKPPLPKLNTKEK
ncbi:hypothetical protein PACTADRAFT_1368 [Pachysolen tannophilus NRRL Y-2460]|uniref:Phosphatidylglycerophosphatase GEP4, mitochondrial n=1 Tax=Pachysolen tannophilus NRRL Y-2460 TaxID=669874 RepID=A0A1E4TYH8_PACTA|nr:hypothetical protein PACTADRAFT_1368 [Pachysolen tannophilus NRRL Y-2460]